MGSGATTNPVSDRRVTSPTDVGLTDLARAAGGVPMPAPPAVPAFIQSASTSTNLPATRPADPLGIAT